MDFPSSPTVGQTHTIGGKTWEWTGTTWDLLSISETQVQRAEDAAVAAQESAEAAADAALNTPLTGLNTSTVGDVTSTDTTLTAFGKVQARLASILTAIGLLAPKENPTFTGTVSGVTKDMVGLGNVDNTSDVDKPISTATQTALNDKAPLDSPALTGTPTAPTPDAADDSTAIATTEFVKAQGYLTSVPVTSVAGKTGAVTLDKGDVGLTNVDNTADADKPVSTAQAAAIAAATQQLALNTQTANYTLALTDAGKCVVMDDANPLTLTVPAEGDVAFPTGTVVFILQAGAGQVGITGDTGVTINTAEGLNLPAQYKMARLIKVGADTWVSVGT